MAKMKLSANGKGTQSGTSGQQKQKNQRKRQSTSWVDRKASAKNRGAE